ncbi:hypothetical protein [Arthrobacter sp. JCM 19049]|uniref:hypothetical protein n=1 Tax=Arthrobacter sp. JCM 19049 TaxID=1460643 RepID=UPI002436ADE5|nr:hypothetical protein [Arthrobacter sp. JCM 19049]
MLCGQQEQLPEDRTTTKNLERWEKIGLLRQGPGWELNEQLLTSALRARARPKPEGVQRFFNGPRLLSLPAKPLNGTRCCARSGMRRLALMRN